LKVYRSLNLVEECLKSKSPTLARTKREKGLEFTEAFLQAWLINLNEILNLNKPMTETQIILCTQEVLNNYSAMNVSDLTLLFKRIMRGEFGEFYESLSIPKVLTFFRDYYEERLKTAAGISLQNHLEQKSNDPLDISKNIKRIWNGTPSN